MQNDLGARRRAPPHELPGKMTPDLAKEIGSIISWTFCCAPGGAPGRFAVAISGWFAALRLCQIGPGSTPLRAFGPPLRAPGADLGPKNHGQLSNS